MTIRSFLFGELKLDVPLVAQEKAYCCWHTASYMIWLYSQGKTGRMGPMNTARVAYARSDTSGISPPEFITLAKKVGLKPLPCKTQYTSKDLLGYLESHGPLWCAGYWFGCGHVIVLAGVDRGNVYFNDPDGGVKKSGTISWFNDKLASSLLGCLMYKNPESY
jgi:hypothetical protein